MQKFNLIPLILLLVLVQGCSSSNIPFLPGHTPRAADNISSQLDAQIMQRARVTSATIPKEQLALKQLELRESITVMSTVPVNINDLEVSCPLARQVSEEISRGMISLGYRFQELRKGKEIFFQKNQGEMLLTRNTALLADRSVKSQAVLAGTYVITPEQVRFSIRLIHTPTNEVLAMGTATVPITSDVRPLIVESNAQPVKVTPTVDTRL